MIKVKVNNEYKDVVKIFCGGTLQKEIIKVWSREAQDYVYESSVEYTGTFPITINANGDALIDYRIYGADGGVGEPTENLFDEATVEPGGYIDPTSGDFVSNSNWTMSDYIKVSGDYINLSVKLVNNFGGWALIHNFYDSNKSWLGGAYTMQGGGAIGVRKSRAFSISGVSYVRVSYRPAIFDDIMLVKGSTEPTEYVPYGYKLPMTIGDGNTAQTVPIYIGENQLTEGEYVSYVEQKIYKRTENLFDGNYVHTYIDLIRHVYSKTNNTRTAVVKVDPSTTYIVKKFDTSNRFIIAEAPEYPRSGIVYDLLNTTNTSEVTITTGNDTIYILIYVSNESFEPKLTVTNSLMNPDSFIPYIHVQDPPVPFPKIPTINGETVIDYDGEPKPSQMYIKYRR